jgi:hypothetical protein
MMRWKRVAALFAFSTFAGVLGAACSAEVQDEPAADATLGAGESAEVPGTAVDAFGSPGVLPGRPGIGGPVIGPGRRRCEDSCRDDYARCGRGRIGPGFSVNPAARELRCRGDLNDCLRRCNRF